MNVSHNGRMYHAREVDGLVQLEPVGAICSLCGAEGPSAEKIPHKPDCPEAKKKTAAA